MRKFILIFLVSLAGCASSLDSGYEPRRLSATDAQRKAYYSSPFSEETQQALHEDRFAEPQRSTRY